MLRGHRVRRRSSGKRRALALAATAGNVSSKGVTEPLAAGKWAWALDDDTGYVPVRLEAESTEEEECFDTLVFYKADDCVRSEAIAKMERTPIGTQYLFRAYGAPACFVNDLEDLTALPAPPPDAEGVNEADATYYKRGIVEAAVLHNLSLRHARQEVYTNCGSVLVSVNPWTWVAGMYSLGTFHMYAPSGRRAPTATPTPRAAGRGLAALPEGGSEDEAGSDASGGGAEGSAESSTARESAPPPHLFELAARAWSRMFDSPGDSKDQSIVIHGPSASGKSVAAAKSVQCLVEMADIGEGSRAAAGMLLRRRVLAASGVLEAFGCASTESNTNSSRHAKWTEIVLDDSQRVVRARIAPYLVEKFRAAGPLPGERNFHVFFALLAGLPSGPVREHLRIDGPDDGPLESSAAAARMPTRKFQLLAPREFRAPPATTTGGGAARPRRASLLALQACKQAAAADGGAPEGGSSGDAGEAPLNPVTPADRDMMEDVVDGLKVLGVAEEEAQSWFSVIAAALHLGNVSFEADSGGGCKVSATTDSEADAEYGSTAALSAAAELLGCSEAALSTALCQRTLVVGGESLPVPLSPDKAEHALAHMISNLYGRMFQYVVDRMNAAMTLEACMKANRGEEGTPDVAELSRATSSTPSGASSPMPGGAGSRASTPAGARTQHSVRVLDMISFEDLGVNHFDQLCANLANERIQQLFTRDCFAAEQKLYEEESVPFATVEFGDNTVVLDLFDNSTSGFIKALEDQASNPRGSDLQLASKFSSMQSKLKTKNPCFTPPTREGLKTSEFRVLHYAGSVQYSVLGFIDMVKDSVAETVGKLVDGCSPFVREQLYRNKPRAPVDSSAAGSTPGGGGSIRARQMALRFGGGSAKFGGAGSAAPKTQHTAPMTAQQRGLVKCTEGTAVLHVRCVTPTRERVPGKFDGAYVLAQLRSYGVVEATAVLQAGYPYHVTHQEFIDRYWFLDTKVLTRLAKTRVVLHDHAVNHEKGAHHVLDEVTRRESESLFRDLQEQIPLLAGSGFQVGKRHIFYRANEHAALERARLIGQNAVAVSVQGAARGFLGRRSVSLLKTARDVLRDSIQKREVEELEKSIRVARSLPFVVREVDEAETLLNRLYEERAVQAKLEQLLKADAMSVAKELRDTLVRAKALGLDDKPCVAAAEAALDGVNRRTAALESLNTSVAVGDEALLAEAIDGAAGLQASFPDFAEAELAAARDLLRHVRLEHSVVARIERQLMSGCFQMKMINVETSEQKRRYALFEDGRVAWRELEAAVQELDKLGARSSHAKRVLLFGGSVAALRRLCQDTAWVGIGRELKKLDDAIAADPLLVESTTTAHAALAAVVQGEVLAFRARWQDYLLCSMLQRAVRDGGARHDVATGASSQRQEAVEAVQLALGAVDGDDIGGIGDDHPWFAGPETDPDRGVEVDVVQWLRQGAEPQLLDLSNYSLDTQRLVAQARVVLLLRVGGRGVPPGGGVGAAAPSMDWSRVREGVAAADVAGRHPLSESEVQGWRGALANYDAAEVLSAALKTGHLEWTDGHVRHDNVETQQLRAALAAVKRRVDGTPWPIVRRLEDSARGILSVRDEFCSADINWASVRGVVSSLQFDAVEGIDAETAPGCVAGVATASLAACRLELAVAELAVICYEIVSVLSRGLERFSLSPWAAAAGDAAVVHRSADALTYAVEQADECVDRALELSVVVEANGASVARHDTAAGAAAAGEPSCARRHPVYVVWTQFFPSEGAAAAAVSLEALAFLLVGRLAGELRGSIIAADTERALETARAVAALAASADDEADAGSGAVSGDVARTSATLQSPLETDASAALAGMLPLFADVTTLARVELRPFEPLPSAQAGPGATALRTAVGCVAADVCDTVLSILLRSCEQRIRDAAAKGEPELLATGEIVLETARGDEVGNVLEVVQRARSSAARLCDISSAKSEVSRVDALIAGATRVAALRRGFQAVAARHAETAAISAVVGDATAEAHWRSIRDTVLQHARASGAAVPQPGDGEATVGGARSILAAVQLLMRAVHSGQGPGASPSRVAAAARLFDEEVVAASLQIAAHEQANDLRAALAEGRAIDAAEERRDVRVDTLRGALRGVSILPVHTREVIAVRDISERVLQLREAVLAADWTGVVVALSLWVKPLPAAQEQGTQEASIKLRAVVDELLSVGGASGVAVSVDDARILDDPVPLRATGASGASDSVTVTTQAPEAVARLLGVPQATAEELIAAAQECVTRIVGDELAAASTAGDLDGAAAHDEGSADRLRAAVRAAERVVAVRPSARLDRLLHSARLLLRLRQAWRGGDVAAAEAVLSSVGPAAARELDATAHEAISAARRAVALRRVSVQLQRAIDAVGRVVLSPEERRAFEPVHPRAPRSTEFVWGCGAEDELESQAGDASPVVGATDAAPATPTVGSALHSPLRPPRSFTARTSALPFMSPITNVSSSIWGGSAFSRRRARGGTAVAAGSDAGIGSSDDDSDSDSVRFGEGGAGRQRDPLLRALDAAAANQAMASDDVACQELCRIAAAVHSLRVAWRQGRWSRLAVWADDIELAAAEAGPTRDAHGAALRELAQARRMLAVVAATQRLRVRLEDALSVLQDLIDRRELTEERTTWQQGDVIDVTAIVSDEDPAARLEAHVDSLATRAATAMERWDKATIDEVHAAAARLGARLPGNERLAQLAGLSVLDFCDLQLARARASGTPAAVADATVAIKRRLGVIERHKLLGLAACPVLDDWAREAVQRGDAVLAFNGSATPAPLTAVPAHLSAVAVRLSRSVLVAAGEEDAREGDDAAGVVVDDIVELGATCAALRDEVLLQLCRHVTGNPSAASAGLGWRALEACLSSFVPSQELENYLEAFLDAAGRGDLVRVLHRTAYVLAAAPSAATRRYGAVGAPRPSPSPSVVPSPSPTGSDGRYYAVAPVSPARPPSVSSRGSRF